MLLLNCKYTDWFTPALAYVSREKRIENKKRNTASEGREKRTEELTLRTCLLSQANKSHERERWSFCSRNCQAHTRKGEDVDRVSFLLLKNVIPGSAHEKKSGTERTIKKGIDPTHATIMEYILRFFLGRTFLLFSWENMSIFGKRNGRS